MKKVIFIAALALMAACGNNPKKVSDKTAENTTRSAETASYKLDDLLAAADGLVDKTVTVTGFVTHTCKHAGKRCFIVGDSQKTSFRIEAKGNIGGFNRELTGSEIAVTGTLRERRLSQEYLDQAEKDANDKKMQEDGSAESCEAELANIAEMKAWMKEHGKDYYAVYYMDGEDYEVVEN